LHDGDKLALINLLPGQHFTEPPPRYTEASLVKELEEKGIGRPSTYAPIISTIQDRGYIIKDGKALKPTEIGTVVNGLLVKSFPQIMDFKFTARLEDELDEITEGKIEWHEVLREFYEPFSAALAEAEVKMEKVKKEIQTSEVCPQCGKPVVIRQGRYGDFMACSGYPKCKFTKPLPGAPGSERLGEKCEKCGKPMVLKQGRFGSFLACSGYPECKNIKPISKKIGVKCPKCAEGELVERRTRRGKVFYGCSTYPKCDFATWQRPVPPSTGTGPAAKEGENA
jgi:DNA topoisomerase-1